MILILVWIYKHFYRIDKTSIRSFFAAVSQIVKHLVLFLITYTWSLIALF